MPAGWRKFLTFVFWFGVATVPLEILYDYTKYGRWWFVFVGATLVSLLGGFVNRGAEKTEAAEKVLLAEARPHGHEVYVRFGEAPADGHSVSRRGGHREAGVAVYPGWQMPDGQLVLDLHRIGTRSYYSGGLSTRQAYLAAGELVATGADGTPLLGHPVLTAVSPPEIKYVTCKPEEGEQALRVVAGQLFTPEMEEYRQFCQVAKIAPNPRGWGAFRCKDPSGGHWTLLTPDIDWVRELVRSQPDKLDIPPSKYQEVRRGWSEEWDWGDSHEAVS